MSKNARVRLRIPRCTCQTTISETNMAKNARVKLRIPPVHSRKRQDRTRRRLRSKMNGPDLWQPHLQEYGRTGATRAVRQHKGRSICGICCLLIEGGLALDLREDQLFRKNKVQNPYNGTALLKPGRKPGHSTHSAINSRGPSNDLTLCFHVGNANCEGPRFGVSLFFYISSVLRTFLTGPCM